MLRIQNRDRIDNVKIQNIDRTDNVKNIEYRVEQTMLRIQNIEQNRHDQKDFIYQEASVLQKPTLQDDLKVVFRIF